MLMLRDEQLRSEGPFGSVFPQVLRQTAAVLVAFTALLASKFDAAALLALLGERLTVTCAPDPSFIGPLITRRILVVINGAAADLHLNFGLSREAWRRGR